MKEKVLFPAQELEIAINADVIVAGGGSAGIAAAIASARNGAKTLLIEQGGCCGGMASRGLLTSIICMTDGENILANGICREFVERIVKDMKLAETSYRWQNIHPESVKKIADQMLAEAGVKVIYETVVTDCIVDNGVIKALKCYAPCGNFAVGGKIFIDMYPARLLNLGVRALINFCRILRILSTRVAILAPDFFSSASRRAFSLAILLGLPSARIRASLTIRSCIDLVNAYFIS